MRIIILLLAACSAWGQIALNYVNQQGSTAYATVTNLNASVGAYSVVFTAPTATSVTGLAVYSNTRGSANVDSLRAQLVEASGSTVGQTVTYTDGSDLVNLTNNTLTNGDEVRFAAATTLPAGIAINTAYYVCNRTATTFQIGNDAGCGSLVTDFSGSSGAQYVVKVIAASTTFTPSPITAGTWIDFTSFSSNTLVAGRKYAVMVINTEAVPATDSVSIQYTVGEHPNLIGNAYGGHTGVAALTTAQAMATVINLRPTGYVTLASGVKLGSPFFTGSTADSNARINGNREVGNKFTTPANVSLNVLRIGVQTGTATGTTFPTSFTLKLYSVGGGGTDTLIDSCTGSLLSNGATICNLSTVRALSPATEYRIAIAADGGSGDASNYVTARMYEFRSGETWEVPLSIQQSYCAGTCTTTANWTNVSTRVTPMVIYLDDSTPFASTGGGSTGGSFVVAQ